MSKITPELSFYGQVLRALEEVVAPYVILGAFAARIFGSTRNTHDIDMIVALEEKHIQALVRQFPLPRYYADPEMMRNSMRLKIMFKLIDTNEGDKVDLIPIGMNAHNRAAMQRRLRLPYEDLNGERLEAWVARPDDVIIGKLLAWNESPSLRHEQDIGQMLVNFYLDPQGLGRYFDEAHADRNIRTISASAWALWQKLKRAAHAEVEKLKK
ncbi:MAG: hypothetical protein HY782_19980 [Chloroflexi bacterium]|nr:hypothetical protein [Chloroflexota bacterium]